MTAEPGLAQCFSEANFMAVKGNPRAGSQHRRNLWLTCNISPEEIHHFTPPHQSFKRVCWIPLLDKGASEMLSTDDKAEREEAVNSVIYFDIMLLSWIPVFSCCFAVVRGFLFFVFFFLTVRSWLNLFLLDSLLLGLPLGVFCPPLHSFDSCRQSNPSRVRQRRLGNPGQVSATSEGSCHLYHL